MKNSIFGKDISPKCVYCENGISVHDGEEILCPKRGVMRPDSCCKKFKYDPLKRAPLHMNTHSDFTAEDFKL